MAFANIHAHVLPVLDCPIPSRLRIFERRHIFLRLLRRLLLPNRHLLQLSNGVLVVVRFRSLCFSLIVAFLSFFFFNQVIYNRGVKVDDVKIIKETYLKSW